MVQISFGGLTFGKLPVVKSVQHGSITLNATETSDTAAITSVDTTNSMILYLSAMRDGIPDTNWDDIMSKVELTNATTVTASRIGPALLSYVKFCVVEFYPGLVKSNQSGTIAITGTSNTATITAVDTAKSICVYLGNTSTTASSAIQYINSALVRVTLTNTTTVTGTRDGSDDAATVGYQVVEFY